MDSTPSGAVSLQRLAKENSHILIPWSHLPIQLGAGFKSSEAKNGNPFDVPSAYSAPTLRNAVIRYTEDDGLRGLDRKVSSSSSMEKSEHLSVSGGISVDCGVVAGSATGSYDKAVLENQDVSKHSSKSSLRLGTISFVSTPLLNLDAQKILRCSQAMKPIALQRFTRKYGDYYVAGIRLGADSSTFVSVDSSSASSSESLTVHLEVRVLFWSASWDHTEQNVSASQSLKFNFAVFDSISQAHDSPKTPQSFSRVRETIQLYSELGDNLTGRVQELKDQLGLHDGKVLQMMDLEEIYKSGLAVELILLPFCFQRNFVAQYNMRP
ncbi:hypothetical protein GGR57DRAFT_485558 [Xylariaceae sp. FL1272]|nr:hypothetical protein GGR57DRAFT_485558 [Xylariaceae sp. FL1272]